MSRTIELTDEQYEILDYAAATRGQSLEVLLAKIVEELRDRDRFPHYYETDDWLRHLGVSEERIQEANARFDTLHSESVDANTF